MSSSYELVESYIDVVLNVQQFNYDLNFYPELQQQLNQFRSWYYIPELDMFGPSKFVGYDLMNAIEYERGRDKDGEATERVLRKFFRRIPRSHPDRKSLESKLFELCSRYDKRPNRSFRINIPREHF